ncbi:23S rRNA (adenosine(1067)-2'-O)-methyltransferase [bacterium HR33]|nr:23S rRNA (adenosine(1067)-2'-O)-methyltransferase [bacterium HR33]
MSSNLVSLVRSLQQRKTRRRRGLAVAEGIRLVEEALAAGVEFRGVLVSPAAERSARGAALLRALGDRAIPMQEVTDRTLEELADTETPQGVIAVVEPKRFGIAEIRAEPGCPVLVLDAVQDPGNVGTLLRTAFALGCSGAILLAGTADPANPKVLRAAMGATFRLPVATAEVGELKAWLRERGVALWAAAAEGKPLFRLEAPELLALAVGNEGAGLRPEVGSLASEWVSVPLARGAESLNVAVAAGIILYEAGRVRRARGGQS